MIDLPGPQIWVPLVLFGVGVVGILVRILPGLVMCWVGVAVWAFDRSTPLSWGLLLAATVITVVGTVLQIVLPHRRLRGQGVATRSMVVGVVFALLGLSIPVIGPPLGFVGGIFVSERIRGGAWGLAWQRTKAALRGILHSMRIELATAGLLLLTLLAGMAASS